jgi:hypothetical protein
MSTMTVQQFYRQHIKPLSVRERLQLVALITQELSDLTSIEIPAQHHLTKLETAQVGAGPVSYGQEYADMLSDDPKGSPKAILRLAGTLSYEEGEAILQVVQESRRIDWELWG